MKDTDNFSDTGHIYNTVQQGGQMSRENVHLSFNAATFSVQRTFPAAKKVMQ